MTFQNIGVRAHDCSGGHLGFKLSLGLPLFRPACMCLKPPESSMHGNFSTAVYASVASAAAMTYAVCSFIYISVQKAKAQTREQIMISAWASFRVFRHVVVHTYINT